MAVLTIVAGECGRGEGEYDTGLFKLPGRPERGAETIAEVVVHGGVAEKQSAIDQVLTGLRGGLSLAHQLDLAAPVSVAASALGAGLGALDTGPKQKALIEVRFTDGATFVAMTDIGIAALMENDRRVILLAEKRFQPQASAPEDENAGLGTRALTSVTDAAGAAGSAVSGAFSFIKNRTIG
ncbi:hypothetical protein [Methylobacterium sp. sgz302541]|uniref:hypothetical protein n=1 Tax=unclassified Methylobacterium TaxID=2615210 RepID=UPI003D350BBC